MRYRFGTKFLYDEDDQALGRRLAAFFQTPVFRDAVLQPRSGKLPTTRENIAEVLVATNDGLSSSFGWAVNRGGKPITGRLALTRNGIWTSGFTSFLEVRFSLSAGYKGGPFRNVEEVRDAALACMSVGPSKIGFVESADEDYSRSNAKFNRFRAIDDMAVPVSMEWVTVLHRDVVANMAVNLRQAENVAGVRVGRSGKYWWIVLCPEPFSFASKIGVKALEGVGRELGLADIHKRFKRTRQ